MRLRAHTPEDLETLLEDAFVTRDRIAVAELFEDGAVLVVGDGSPARGGCAIANLARAMWDCDVTFVADPRRVLQARDMGLVVADQSINVVRRGSDGTWRYAISLLFCDHTITKEQR